jgi:hypothetical protein
MGNTVAATELDQATADALWRDAVRISWPGAVNPTAIAGTIARNSSAMVPILGTERTCKHPAMQAMVGQLAYICGIGLGPSVEVCDLVMQHGRRLGIID